MEKKADAKLHKMVAGGYKIMEKLGSGSFGEIFKGRHVTTGEEVAIKFVMVGLIRIGASSFQAQAVKARGKYLQSIRQYL